MEDILKITNFVYNKYGTLTSFMMEYSDKNLGYYSTIKTKRRDEVESIYINTKKIEKISKLQGIDYEYLLLFVLLHEVGHFLLNKARYCQKESYADYCSLYIMKKIFNYEKSKLKRLINFIEIDTFIIPNEEREELEDVCNLFVHQYKKFYTKYETTHI